MVKRDVVAPMLSAITSTEISEKPGERSMVRVPDLRSRTNCSGQFQFQVARVRSRIRAGLPKARRAAYRGFFLRHSPLPLLLFLQLEVGTQLALEFRVPFPRRPPFHLNSPLPPATSPAPQPRPSASIATPLPPAVSCPSPLAGST